MVFRYTEWPAYPWAGLLPPYVRKRDRERYKQLALFFRERRTKVRKTESAVAMRSGLAQPFISDLERFERFPDVFDFFRLARGLDMTAKDVYGLLEQLVDDSSLDLPPIPPPPPRQTKGRPKASRD